MAIATIPQRAMSEQGFAFRNLIINGDMSLAQRGTSTSGITGNGYAIDRYRHQITSAGTWTISQSTDVPTGQGFAYSQKLDCTTADASLGASDRIRMTQRIEGNTLQSLKFGTSNAESITISFWVKSNKTGTYSWSANDDQNTKLISASYTIDSANTWEKKTLTFAGTDSPSIGIDNTSFLQCSWWLGTGSTYSGGTYRSTWTTLANSDEAAGQTVNLADDTANEWYITGVQLEVGTTASDFEFLPYDVNLRRCERYFQKHDGFEGTASQTTQFQSVQTFHTPMRANPSASISGVLVVTDTDADYTQSSANGAITAGRVSTTAVQLNFGNFSGMTRFRPTQQNVGANSCHMQMDAEL
jgi:hypothetical protein